MRKMTKTVAVLAAMSAMTVASASMAFADEPQLKNVSSIANSEEVEAGAVSGTWKDEGKDGWTFTVDGKKLKDTWAEIDGIWYYFDGTEMAQNRILELDEEFYYFDHNGTLATGWQKITSEMDAYSDIELSEQLDDQAKAQKDDGYTYYDYVWCYFHEDGTAAINEWKQSEESGLWYWMDEMVMVHSNYTYLMDTVNYDDADSDKYDIYGFAEDGHMYVGWTPAKDTDGTKNKPTASEGKKWYYYKSNGKMVGNGWNKIDGDWYLFVADEDDSVIGLDGNTRYAQLAVMNAYVTSYNKKAADGGKAEYFYLDSKGVMKTGVVTLPSDIYYVTFYDNNTDVVTKYDDVNMEASKVSTGKPEVFFGSNGAAKTAWEDDRYFTIKTGDIAAVNGDIVKVANTNSVLDAASEKGASAVTGYTIYNKNGNTYYGALVKNAWVKNGDTVSLVDEDGDMLENKAILIGTLNGEEVYVLLDRYGEAYTGYNTSGKTVNVNKISFTATGDFVEDLTLNVNIPNQDKVSLFIKTN